MQDNKGAYIAGKNMALGSSAPSSFTSSQQQSFQAAQDEKAYVEKAKGNQSENVQNYQFQTEAYQNAPSPEAVAEATKKDPYDVLTREQEIAAGFPKTGIEELAETTGIKIPNLTLQGLGLSAKALQALLDKAFKPEAKDFSNPNFLAVLNAAFKSGKLNKDEYTEKYKELLDEVYGGQAKDPEMQTKLLEEGIAGLDTEGLFDLAIQQATEGVLPGSGTQRITDPASFYEETGMPVTSGDLLNLANLDAQQFLSGENYNPKLAQMIFDARAELNRMGKNTSTGTSNQGIMAASPALPGISVPAGGTIPAPKPGPITTNPVLSPVPVGGITPTTTTGITPFNINQFYASLPQYTQQGVMSPNLAQYYQNLGLFPGMNV
jgi:hypothetical protein